VTILSRFVVANGIGTDVREAFVNRPHLVENAPGFLRLEVLSPTGRPSSTFASGTSITCTTRIT
jgi:heme-degrading monooxygenase HmoA